MSIDEYANRPKYTTVESYDREHFTERLNKAADKGYRIHSYMTARQEDSAQVHWSAVLERDT